VNRIQEARLEQLFTDLLNEKYREIDKGEYFGIYDTRAFILFRQEISLNFANFGDLETAIERAIVGIASLIHQRFPQSEYKKLCLAMPSLEYDVAEFYSYPFKITFFANIMDTRIAVSVYVAGEKEVDGARP